MKATKDTLIALLSREGYTQKKPDEVTPLEITLHWWESPDTHIMFCTESDDKVTIIMWHATNASIVEFSMVYENLDLVDDEETKMITIFNSEETEGKWGVIDLEQEGKRMTNNEDKLVSFFYELIRDHITPGAVEAIMRNTEHVELEIVYSNKHLEAYARSLVQRLSKGQ